jgi:hypothetical protein
MILVLGCLWAAGCSGGSAPDAQALLAPFLEGEDKMCLEDEECTSTVCLMGVCAGLLTADREWMTEAVADALAADLRARGLEPRALRPAVERALADREGTPDFRRARLLRGWARVDRPGAAEAARRVLDLPEEALIVRFEAARVLARGGDAQAQGWLAEQVQAQGAALAWFLAADLPFFAPGPRAAILESVTRAGASALLKRITDLQEE